MNGIEKSEQHQASECTNNATAGGYREFLPDPPPLRVLDAVEPESVVAKCGNLEIQPPSEGRLFGRVLLDGVEVPFLTSIKLTWSVEELWRCELGVIVDERVRGKRQEATG